MEETGRAHMKMPSTTCQSFTTATVNDQFNGDCLGPRGGPVSVRTEILFDNGGILRIYHLGRKAYEIEVRSGGMGYYGRHFGERLCLGAQVTSPS